MPKWRRGQGEFKDCSRRREEAEVGREKQFRLVTSAATALATILEPTSLRDQRLVLRDEREVMRAYSVHRGE